MEAIEVLAADGDLNAAVRDPAAVYAAIAIGAQSHKQCDMDERYASAYFHAARTASDDPLAMPTVKSATISVLNAFFMLASHRRNAAYMYVGAAARAAQALGLHHQSSYGGAQDTESLRRYFHRCFPAVNHLTLTLPEDYGCGRASASSTS